MSIRGLADVVTDFFFDELEVEHAARVPTDRPVILAANHHSGLMDALLLYAASPVPIRAVGKSTLWKILPLRPFLAAAKVIPIHRTKDGGGDNSRSFAAVSEALVEGGVIAIFVEGTSHDNPGLERIKTGAARMAFDAINAGADVAVVPVGIIFENRERFRSDALVRFGEPFVVSDAFDRPDSQDREQVKDLTAEIERRLRIVAPSWDSHEQRASARSAAIETLPVGSSLGEVEAAAEALARDDQLGEAMSDQVGLRGEADLLVPPDEIDPVSAAILWPFATVGRITNLPPYMTVARVARSGPRNLRATLKAAGGLVLFPLWWTAIALVVRWFSGSWTWALWIAAGVAILGVIAARELPLAAAERRTRRVLRSVDRDEQ